MLTVTEGIYALKVAELLKYVLWEPVACDNMAVVMDLKVWNSLPPEIKVIIQEINEEMKYWYVETVKTDQENQERVRKAGIEIYRFDPGEKAALQAAIDPVTQNWVERMEGKGIPAKKVDNEMRRILKQY
jgi:TRAP-type C4-dicarboxylate transport system substrate-binding protein